MNDKRGERRARLRENGRRLQRARRSVGLSRSALAEKVDCTPRAILTWERGEHEPQEHWWPALAEALGVEQFGDIWRDGP